MPIHVHVLIESAPAMIFFSIEKTIVKSRHGDAQNHVKFLSFLVHNAFHAYNTSCHWREQLRASWTSYLHQSLHDRIPHTHTGNWQCGQQTLHPLQLVSGQSISSGQSYCGNDDKATTKTTYAPMLNAACPSTLCLVWQRQRLQRRKRR